MDNKTFSALHIYGGFDTDVICTFRGNDRDNDLLEDSIRREFVILDWRLCSVMHCSQNRAGRQSRFRAGLHQLLSVILFSGCLIMAAHADTQPIVTDADVPIVQYGPGTSPLELAPRNFYAGIGLGSSWLDPDTSEAAGVDTNDRVQAGFQINLGLDVNKWMSVELHAAELGDAGLSDGTEVGYREFGVSGLLYVGKARHRFQRRGLTGYGRLGLGALRNSASAGVQVDQDNDIHALFGVGLELMTRQGFGFRAEAIAYEEDVRYGQLGLIYRFGRQRKAVRAVRAGNSPHTQLLSPSNGIAVSRAGADDNVKPTGDSPSLDDQCQVSDTCEIVDPSGGAFSNSTPKVVYFRSGSLTLSDNARQKLDDAIATLNAHPNQSVLLTSHTDNRGSEQSNSALSHRRAAMVVSYLLQGNVDESRITVVAYGESQPTDGNDTAEGRQNNRRVELSFQRLQEGVANFDS